MYALALRRIHSVVKCYESWTGTIMTPYKKKENVVVLFPERWKLPTTTLAIPISINILIPRDETLTRILECLAIGEQQNGSAVVIEGS